MARTIILAARWSAVFLFQPFQASWCYIRDGGILLWKWSVPHRNSHRPDDQTYAAVWRIDVDAESVRNAVHAAFPELPRDESSTEEEALRQFLRKRWTRRIQTHDRNYGHNDRSTVTNGQQRLMTPQETCEELFEHVPLQIRHYLAAANAVNLERKLLLIFEEHYHCSAGLGSVTRSSAAISKTFRLWRLGFVAAVSTWERIAVYIFFFVLAFMACYPDVAAGFLGERSYNQRSIGSRIFTLIQLFFLWTFPYHSLWLLFNWGLERLLGALVGNTVYALIAILPDVRTAYGQNWLRITVLVLSVCWQVSVQFFLPLRDFVVRFLTRRQMLALRKRVKCGDTIDWDLTDEKINKELVSHKSFVEQQEGLEGGYVAWQDVPIKVRVERYIQFTSAFTLGRSANQLISLLKDDMENIINTLEDYRLSTQGADKGKDKGHVEPRLPKLVLVFLDIVIFTYVCYSFRTQPFTFNTVVAYSSVVIVKQTIFVIKRYQTIKNARRLFTNMVSVNILGMLLVSTPVIVDKDVLADTRKFVALTIAMVFATLLFAEPIAPLLLALTEKCVAGSLRLKNIIKTKRQTCQK
ncbi:hypothetical protein K4F52_009972 [Lecanicillium sp. MT-2017a]|nr:hypothetical protein K4F52_009972 [Lecanicillium sp. MT-2017a]